MSESDGKTVKIDTDVARAFAAHLNSATDGLDPVLAKIEEILDTFRRETAQGVQGGHQAPYYSALDASLQKSLRKIADALVQNQRNALRDVHAVSSLTEGLEDVATAAATKIANISVR